jgi:DNA mismatch repair protein MutH
VETPLHRPTATARRLLAWAQAGAVAAVLGLAAVVGTAVQAHLDAHPDRPAVLVEVPGGVVAGGPSEHDGALAGIGVVVVGWTLVGCAGTVGRRRLDDRDSDRWERGWAAVEPTWSGRVEQ